MDWDELQLEENMRRSHSLPHDVVLDILLRLPVKSLKRFKCVCKSWCSNFEETDFIRKHHLSNAARGTNLCTLVKSVPIFDDRFGTNVILSPGETWQPRIVVNFSLLSNETIRVRETINIPSVDFPACMSMVDECEGLILLRGCCAYDNPDPVLLLNPATQELKTLPQSSVEHPLNKEISGYCGFGL
ncbi:F-box protein At1g11270-like [Tripterygium wilfordii]|uniref:F-box protein At1g11270-like n=1 Tax=Tripterygium wilfordii TaxID=458696 RepID=UPI0018F8288F|nr:F-box protein At1g11270-like [Tripterygium wilfordii]